MLSLGIEILCMNGLDFKEKQIYGIEYRRHTMVMKHKKYKNTYVEFKGLFFLSIGIDDNPDCAQSANVDESEHCAN